MLYAKEDEKNDDSKSGPDFTALMMKARTVLVNGEVDQEMSQKVIAQLVVLDQESHDPIRVIVTSQGGHVDAGYAIHDMLRFIESKVICIGAGWVASIAVPILFGATKENRYSLPSTRYLLHQPSGGADQWVAQARYFGVKRPQRRHDRAGVGCVVAHG